MVDAYNNVISFDVSGIFKPYRDFGLVWNAAIETGVVVSEEVKLEINAEFKEENNIFNNKTLKIYWVLLFIYTKKTPVF